MHSIPNNLTYITFNIKPHELVEGIPGSARHSTISKAFKRQYRDADSIITLGQFVYVDGKCLVPVTVQAFHIAQNALEMGMVENDIRVRLKRMPENDANPYCDKYCNLLKTHNLM